MAPRSPILFWLLLAATLAVDTVAIGLMSRDGLTPLAGAVFLSLALSQLSVVCFWAVMVRSRMGGAWMVPMALGVPAAIVINSAAGKEHDPAGEIMFAYLGLMWFHVAVALVALWILKPTRLFAAAVPGRQQWQFAVRDLLVLMTCLAVLASLMSNNSPIVQELSSVVTLVAGSVTLLLAAIAAGRRLEAWYFRLATDLAVAMLIAELCARLGIGFADHMSWRALYLIQAIVIWAWLEFYRQNFDDGESSPEATS